MIMITIVKMTAKMNFVTDNKGIDDYSDYCNDDDGDRYIDSC